MATPQITWPERTPVAHKETGARGRIAACPPGDPIARDYGGGRRAHLPVAGGIAWVEWDDGRPPCWITTRWLEPVRRPA